MGNEVIICYFYSIFGFSNRSTCTFFSNLSLFLRLMCSFFLLAFIRIIPPQPHPWTHYPVYSMGIITVQEDSWLTNSTLNSPENVWSHSFTVTSVPISLKAQGKVTYEIVNAALFSLPLPSKLANAFWINTTNFLTLAKICTLLTQSLNNVIKSRLSGGAWETMNHTIQRSYVFHD